jgi:tetratricopeptide (TPR) repeat protein
MLHFLNQNNINASGQYRRGGFFKGIPFFIFTHFFIFFGCSHLSASGFTGEPGPNGKKALLSMVRLDFVGTIKYLQEEKKLNPGSFFCDYVELKAMSLKLLVNEDHQSVSAWEEGVEEFERKLKAKNFTGKNNYVWRAELLLMKAFLNIRKEKYFVAVKDFNNAYHFYLSGLTRYPDNLELRKGAALVNILLGVVPENYRWALKVLGFDGDLVKGLNGLKSVISLSSDSSETYLKEEALFLYTTLGLNFGKKNSGLLGVIYANKAHIEQNPLIRYAFTAAVLKETNAKAALELFGPTQPAENLPHLFYLKGYLLLLEGDSQAGIWLKKFLKIHKGKMLVAASYQKLSWVYYLNSDLKQANFYKEKVLETGLYPTDEDLQAKNAAMHPMPAKCLLRARLDFDGGFYQKSLKQLLSCGEGELKNTSEHLEFLYRLGRVQQKLGNAEKALHYFDLTISRGDKHKDYYAPAAALYAGNMLEELGNIQKARDYYKKVFEFKDYPYERSLSQKAKAGLSRIKALK